MTDYRRAEWQIRANKIAEAVLIGSVLLSAEEITFAILFHFPLWDDIAMAVTMPIVLIAKFVRDRTQQYRFDI
jgi:hypothetical protein